MEKHTENLLLKLKNVLNLQNLLRHYRNWLRAKYCNDMTRFRNYLNCYRAGIKAVL